MTGNDSVDYEGLFYTVLKDGLEGVKLPGVDDLMKITDGPQAQIDSNGNTGVLIVLTPEGADLMLTAAKHQAEHQCDESMNYARLLLAVVGGLVSTVASPSETHAL